MILNLPQCLSRTAIVFKLWRLSLLVGLIGSALGVVWSCAIAVRTMDWTSSPSHIASMLALVIISSSLATGAAPIVFAIRAQRSGAHDLRRAQEVQETLLAHGSLALRTLEVAGRSLQACGVGGDYCDLIELGADRTGLVVGDVSGKGICAAMLMANLQALLRSQCASGAQDLGLLLASVNSFFCKSTGHVRFATLFFGVYNDWTRRLEYVNCGHNAPLLLRHDGTLQLLGSTATVLGLFDEWSCEVGNVRLHAGDTLIVFSDGVVEAVSSGGKEFGEHGLLAVARSHLDLPAPLLVDAVFADVRAFTAAAPADDLTLLIARAH